MLAIGVLSVLGILVLFLGFAKSRDVLLPAAMMSLLVTFALLFFHDWHNPDQFADLTKGMLTIDTTSVLFGAVILWTSILMLPLSEKYLLDHRAQPAEYYAILLFSIVGALMMVTFDNLLMLFIGVEILSIAMYVLTGSDKRNLRGNEAAL